MTYLLYGIDTLVKENIKNIINHNKIDDINISKYNSESLISEIIEDAETIPLFGDKKLIIVENSQLFNNKYKEDITLLERFITSKSENTILIFSNNSSVDSRKKIYKVIQKYGKIIDLSKPTNLIQYTKKLFDGYTIHNNSINLLIDRIGNDIDLLNREAEKIKLYKINEKIITDQDIINLTIEKINIDIFKFIDNIIAKNKHSVIKTYKELIKVGEEPIKIIVMLSNQFRLMYQVKVLTKKGYNEDEISNLLNIKKYPVHLAILKGYKYPNDVILDYLEKLADLDIKIKTGKIDKTLALELFLLML